jgi:putative radical SAM enzyme (TIGR03279 family)
VGRRQPEPKGGIISAVVPGSIAEELELCAGDVVLAIDGVPLRDTIDYRFAIAESSMALLVRTADGETLYEIEKDPDDDLGILFDDPLFDRIRTCNNACTFCFVVQMPRGMRKTLYVKDDDYRLSFLYANFITLTNLSESDWQRLHTQHLSPLYISVHATDPVVRARLLGRPTSPDVLAQIARLGDMGIHVHTQVVVCPGVNDGAVLARTIEDLAALFPVVQSIGVVPVGVTRCRYNHTMPQQIETTALRCYTPAEAAATLDMVLAYGERYHDRLGSRLVYPADEFFLLCGREIPAAPFYEEAPQYFNGIGMTRDFLDTWARVADNFPPSPAPSPHIALVCGTLIAPVLRPLAAYLATRGGWSVEVVAVVNQFFGEQVTVSGLLTGHDVLAALPQGRYHHVILPRTMFDHTGLHTLDDMRPQHIAQETGATVTIAGYPDELVALFAQMPPAQQLESRFGSWAISEEITV